MKFKIWIESTTINRNNNDQLKQYVPNLEQYLRTVINNQKDINAVVNYFANLYHNENINPTQIGDKIRQDWGTFGAFITDCLVGQRNFLTNPQNLRQQLIIGNQIYHNKLTTNNTRKGPEGLPIVNVSEMLTKLQGQLPNEPKYNPQVWAGWNWVSVGCVSSNEEAAAGGHCGNSSGRKGDNIVSLRDGRNHVRLTFIVNTITGELVESKSLNNEKPEEKYHPAIVTLLTSGYIKKIDSSRSYLPENDFKLDDIKDQNLLSIIKDKMSQNAEHKVPDNYLPLSWLTQWTQEQVDALPPQDKFGFLQNVIRVFHNHKLHSNDEYEIKFNFEKLVLDAINSETKIKKLIESVDRIMEMIGDKFPLSKDTLNIIAEKLSSNFPQGSFRDKISIFQTIENIGYNVWAIEHPRQGNRFAIEDEEEGNAYQQQLDGFESQIINEILNKGEIPDSAAGFISSYLEKSRKVVAPNAQHNFYFDMLQDGSKITSVFTIKDSWNLSEINKRIEQFWSKLKPLLVKNGYSLYNQHQYSYGKKKDTLLNDVVEIITPLMYDKMKRKILGQIRNNIRLDFGDRYWKNLTYFHQEPPLDIIRRIENKQPLSEIEHLDKMILRLQNESQQWALDNLESILTNNIEKLVELQKNRRRANPNPW